MTCVISGLDDCPPPQPRLEPAPSCHSVRHYRPRHHCHHQLASGVNRYYCLYFLPITGANFVMALLALEPQVPGPARRALAVAARTITRPPSSAPIVISSSRLDICTGNRPKIFPQTSRTGCRITIIPFANMAIISANTTFPFITRRSISSPSSRPSRWLP